MEYVARRRLLQVGVASILAAATGGCDIPSLRRWSYRFRMTVEVMHQGVIRTGSTVVEIHRKLGYDSISTEAEGEAAIIHMGDGYPILFATLRGPSGTESWAAFATLLAFKKRINMHGVSDSHVLDRLVVFDGIVPFTAEKYPTFAYFEDIKSPETFRKVLPDNLESVFGAGTYIRAVNFKLTDETMTSNLPKLLPWFPEYLEMIRGEKIERFRGATTILFGLGGYKWK